MIAPIAPTIHLNGSDPDALLEALETTLSAFYKAGNALAECAPNGRDYPEDFPVAREQHAARQRALGKIVEELQAIYESVQDQKDARLARR